MLLIYGVTGFTGRIVAEAAVTRGLPVVVAGRSSTVESVAAELAVPGRRFSLDSSIAARDALENVKVVLNCAGPFERTTPPLLQACLSQGVHYLDLAGEAREHKAVAALDAQARTAGIALVPGVGFGIVPTDCAAALATAAVDDVQQLIIAYETRGKPSRGTLATVLPELHRPGVQRYTGRERATRGGERSIVLADGRRKVRVTTNPWRADVFGAIHSTAAPTIETYATFPLAARILMRIGGSGLGRVLAGQALARAAEGPTMAERSRDGVTVWAVARGRSREARVVLHGPDAYDFTALAAVECAARALDNVPAGYQTPSTAFGADVVRAIPGVRIAITQSPGRDR